MYFKAKKLSNKSIIVLDDQPNQSAQMVEAFMKVGLDTSQKQNLNFKNLKNNEQVQVIYLLVIKIFIN